MSRRNAPCSPPAVARRRSRLPACWLRALAALCLLAPAVAWNVTCASPCACQLHTSELSQAGALRTVNCSFQQLRALPSDLPKDTEALLLAGNALTELFDYVPDLLELRELDVTGNRVRSLGRRYIFHNLSGLTYLSLARNELVSLVRDAFVGLVRLQVLVVAENRINQIEDQAFHGLTSLLTLDLGRNQLSALYPEWFLGLDRLRELYLYENRVHLLNGATFRPLPRLRHLSLHGNRIAHVNSDAFWGTNELEALHLERNYLREVPARALQRPYLPSLSALFLSGNPMAVLRAGDFADLRLREVALNSMPWLRLVEAGAFRNLSHLASVELRDCPLLASVDPESFVNASALARLDLRRCALLALPREVAKALATGAVVSLSGNPLLCDCNVRWIRLELELAEQNRSRVRLAEPEALLCASPEHARHTPVRQLDPAGLGARCPPSILPLMDNVVEKTLGDPLSLDCRAAGVPRPRLGWTLAGGRTPAKASSNAVRVQARTSGTLYFYHVKEEDGGNYTCLAENGEGQPAVVEVSLRVKRIDIHIFPTGVSSTFVTVVWNGTARNSFQKFQILYRMMDDGRGGGGGGGTNATAFEHVTVSQFHRSFTVNNLRPESTYEFCIAFEDRDGYFVQISCTTVRTRDADYMLQGVHHTSNVAVAAALGVVVAMVMVVCVVSVAARKYRQRQYVCPDKPVVHRMSHIPLENLYSPLMSNAGP